MSFEPYDHDDAMATLAEQLKSARLGASLDIARGVTVKVVAAEHGQSHVRRYYVAGDQPNTLRRTATREQIRHAGTIKTADEAARIAVEISRERADHGPTNAPTEETLTALGKVIGVDYS